MASHSLTNLRPVRAAGERLLGRVGFTAAYSALSLLLLGWMIAAYRDAPTVVLWDQAAWMRWVPAIAMLAACLLWAAGLSSANPFSIGPGGKGFDPARPGILRLTRHPILWGLSLWAAAHMIPNGDAAALLLFVPLALLAMVGPAMLDRKRRRGLADFAALAALTGKPRMAMIGEIGWKRMVAGLILYRALIALHPWVIGADPLP